MSLALTSPRSPLTARIVRRTMIVGAASAAGVLLFAAPAFAHITVSPASVPVGSTTELTFHVPNEEAKASTVKVDVQIPTTHPIAQLLAKPVPGWTATVRTIKLPKPVTTDDGTFTTAVSEVIWSGGSIEPGQFQDFSISCDSLPDGPGQLVFKAIQTYSDGDIVRWIDLSQPGQPEPAHPAPTVTLTAVTNGSTGSTGPGTAKAAATTTASSSADSLARVLGIAGLLIGLLAVLLVLAVFRRDRRLLAEIGTAPVPAPPPRKLPRQRRRATARPRSSRITARQQARRRPRSDLRPVAGDRPCAQAA